MPASPADPEPAAKAAGKGRPTPKRRESEQRRRQPVAAPKTRREAYKQARQRSREARRKARQALRTGDDRYLPPRDAGPVRRYVRDIVDARRNIGDVFLLIVTVIVILGFIPVRVVQLIVLTSYPVLLIAVVVDCVRVVRLVRRKVQAKFPDAELRGLGSYAVLRALQLRRLRLPPPRVRVGARV